MRATSIAVLLLAAGLPAAGCSDDGSAPERVRDAASDAPAASPAALPSDASRADFCRAGDPTQDPELSRLLEQAEAGGDGGSALTDLAAGLVARIRAVGTPPDASAEVRAGLAHYLTLLEDADAAALAWLGSAGSEEPPVLAGLSAAERAQIDAYGAYELATCTTTDRGAASGGPSTAAATAP